MVNIIKQEVVIDTKHDLACKIVIELGNMEYYYEKSLEYKYQMTQVFEQQLEEIQKNCSRLLYSQCHYTF